MMRGYRLTRVAGVGKMLTFLTRSTTRGMARVAAVGVPSCAHTLL